MKNKTLLILVLTLGILTSSCQPKESNNSQKTQQIEKSKFFTDSIFSKNLNEYRKHRIYLPKGFDKAKKYPIIYATDGGSALTDKKEVLDSLIENGTIKPVIFVASFANDKIADSTSMTLGGGKKVKLTYRNFEYINNFASIVKDSSLVNRFENHKLYFSNELISHIEKEYNQNNGKEYRYFYGVSNGAGFGLSLLNEQPELIGTYLCFSTYGGNIETNNWNTEITYPKLYLKYGSEELSSLKEKAEFLKQKYTDSKSFIDIEEFNGGHHNKVWKKEFAETIGKILN